LRLATRPWIGFFLKITTKIISVVKNMYGERGLYCGAPEEWALVYYEPLQRSYLHPLSRRTSVMSLRVSDCVEMYQNGQDENAAFFWHQICCASRQRGSQSLAITRDTKKTDQKAKFLSGCPRRKSPIFISPVLTQFQVTADTYGASSKMGAIFSSSIAEMHIQRPITRLIFPRGGFIVQAWR